MLQTDTQHLLQPAVAGQPLCGLYRLEQTPVLQVTMVWTTAF
jgi:hypothetical protein